VVSRPIHRTNCDTSDNVCLNFQNCRYSLYSITYNSILQALPKIFHMILLGKAGTSKSSTGNSILGQHEFDSAPGGNLKAYNCARKATDRFDHRLLVIDTSGIIESDRVFLWQTRVKMYVYSAC